MGVKYKVAVYSAAAKAFKLAASSGVIAKTFLDNKSTGTKQDWTGVAAASTNFIALCGDKAVSPEPHPHALWMVAVVNS